MKHEYKLTSKRTLKFEKEMTLHLTYARQLHLALLYFSKRNAMKSGSEPPLKKKRIYQKAIQPEESRGVGLRAVVNMDQELGDYKAAYAGTDLPIQESMYIKVNAACLHR